MGVNRAVLVLNLNYEPLNVCSARRAFVLVSRGKAEIIENTRSLKIRTPLIEFKIPSVIRMVYLIKRPRPKLKLTRREIFIRDHYTCQYCGITGRDLTIDHVIPRRYGGKFCWENLVSACHSCNHKKGSKTPEEARMRLLRHPYRPHPSSYYILREHIRKYSEWSKFIPEWEMAGI